MGTGSWSNDATNLMVLVEQISGYSGIFGYSPAPGTGTLVFSLTAVAGTDPYGNAYQAGLTTYGAGTSINIDAEDIVLAASNGSTADLFSGLNAGLSLTPAGGPWSRATLLSGVGGGSHPLVTLSSPADTTNGFHSAITLEGSSAADVTTIILSSATRWTHTGQFFSDNIQSGSFSITPTVAGQWTANQAVSFATTFAQTPVVMVTPSANGPGVGTTTKLEWQTTGVTTTGFNCRILRDNTTATTLSWLAISTN